MEKGHRLHATAGIIGVACVGPNQREFAQSPNQQCVVITDDVCLLDPLEVTSGLPGWNYARVDWLGSGFAKVLFRPDKHL